MRKCDSITSKHLCSAPLTASSTSSGDPCMRHSVKSLHHIICDTVNTTYSVCTYSILYNLPIIIVLYNTITVHIHVHYKYVHVYMYMYACIRLCI